MDERPMPIDRDPGGDPASAVDDDTTGSTGVAAVDQVLADVAALSGTPVSEHVAVFERAHDQLRRALDAQPDAQPDAPAHHQQDA